MGKRRKRWEHQGVSLSKENKQILDKINENKHKKALEDISNNPGLVGIFGEIFSETEIPLYNYSLKVGALDLLLRDPKKGVVYYIEYKCNHSKNNEEEAKNQLLKAKNRIDEKYRGGIERFLYVSGKFVTKELVDDEWKEFKLSA